MTPERLVELLERHGHEVVGGMYIRPPALAWLLGISLKTLYNRRDVGKPALPPEVDLPGRLRYDVVAIAAWLTEEEGKVPEVSLSHRRAA